MPALTGHWETCWHSKWSDGQCFFNATYILPNGTEPLSNAIIYPRTQEKGFFAFDFEQHTSHTCNILREIKHRKTLKRSEEDSIQTVHLHTMATLYTRIIFNSNALGNFFFTRCCINSWQKFLYVSFRAMQVFASGSRDTCRGKASNWNFKFTRLQILTRRDANVQV